MHAWMHKNICERTLMRSCFYSIILYTDKGRKCLQNTGVDIIDHLSIKKKQQPKKHIGKFVSQGQVGTDK